MVILRTSIILTTEVEILTINQEMEIIINKDNSIKDINQEILGTREEDAMMISIKTLGL